jgi:hypothetical protein
MDAEGEAFREVADRSRIAFTSRGVRQVRRRDCRERHEVRGLVFGRGQPDQVRVFDDGVEHHEALDGAVDGHAAAEGAVWLANGRIERPLVQVVERARLWRQSYIDA